MAGAVEQPEAGIGTTDAGAAGRFPGVMRALDLLNGIGSLWIVGLMVMICTDAIARTFFDRPISGVSELTALSIVGIVFLQVGATCLRGRLTCSDLITGLLDLVRPRIGALLKAVFALIGALTFAALAWVSLPGLIAAWNVPEYTGVSGIYRIPVLPFRLLIVLGAGLAALGFVLRLVCFLGQVRQLPSRNPGVRDD